MSNYIFRELEENDWECNYLQLLSQLSRFKTELISKDEFVNFVNNLNNNHKIFVLFDKERNLVVASITLLIERKIIHNMGLVCHIEDVIVHNCYRGKKLGKEIVEKSIDFANKKKCYKIILNCTEKLQKFYEKFNFKYKNIQMAIYN